jgi:16S rRNA (uracil1498-N3)-methyltransferase
MNLFFSQSIQENRAHFSTEESNHMRHSLRMREGSSIHFTDGLGRLYTGNLVYSGKAVTAEITHRENIEREYANRELYVAPIKQAERLDWMIEKAVELGVSKIAFLHTQRTERRKVNMDRVQRICIAAMKQSGQFYLPEIIELREFKKAIADPIEGIGALAWCGEMDHQELEDLPIGNQHFRICIGPEGDFTMNEAELAFSNGYIKTSLGKTRLRTETAAIYALAVHKSLCKY